MEEFKDYDSRGKDRNWKEKKKWNLLLHARLEECVGYHEGVDVISEARANRVFECSRILMFGQREDGTNKLIRAGLCRDRLCAICAWRRAIRYSHESYKTFEQLVALYPGTRLIFLTFTLKNCEGSKLKEMVKRLNSGVLKVMGRKDVSKYSLGYVKTLEVTVNRKSESFHPHVHIMLAVKKAYFKKGYISKSKWTELWKKSTKSDYSPQVWVTAVDEKNLDKSIRELTKYQVKASTFLSDTTDPKVNAQDELKAQDRAIVVALYRGLHHARFISFNGELKKIHHDLFPHDKGEKKSSDEEMSEEELLGLGEGEEGKKIIRIFYAYYSTKLGIYYLK